MIRFICCLATTVLAAACVPPKAVFVEAAPVLKVKNNKPGGPSQPQETLPPMPLVVQQNGMRVPDMTSRLPDKKDLTATTQPKTGAGGTVIATPPGGKPANE